MTTIVAHPVPAFIRVNGPGVGLSLTVAVVAYLAEPLLAGLINGVTGTSYKLPNMVIALILGVALYGVASQARFQPGITWCVKKLLRMAIGLLGLRIALGDILALGVGTVLLVIFAMALTVATGFLLARLLGREPGYGALAGAATAVCGASAALATTTVLPDYANKEADTAFTVIAANAISTLVMVAYPPMCLWLGLSATHTGILLGATIHDMAQVVGAGYAVSETVGNTALIVKLFRVFLLLPAVLMIGWWFTRSGARTNAAKVPTPVFAVVFVVLAILNTILVAIPSLQPAYGPIKLLVNGLSNWGMLISIAALGLGTSVSAILRIGWRHIAVFFGTTIVILGTIALRLAGTGLNP